MSTELHTNKNSNILEVNNHDRDSAGFSYVYPVVSRRAGGVSIGINLNPNNCCNWHCVYCQVPSLSRGHAPMIDVEQLSRELDAMLDDILHGDFMKQRVAKGSRVLSDIAFSGNGEPTSSPQFQAIVRAVIQQKEAHALHALPLRLISNGSYMMQHDVQKAIAHMSRYQGEVWVKVDAGMLDDAKRINGVAIKTEQCIRHVEVAASCCPTWIQSCFFEDVQGRGMTQRRDAYLQLLQQIKNKAIPVRGILLYGLARPSLQKEAKDLRKLPAQWLEALADKIHTLGFDVTLH